MTRKSIGIEMEGERCEVAAEVLLEVRKGTEKNVMRMERVIKQVKIGESRRESYRHESGRRKV